ncbi:sensor histidine kinase [Fibrisoma montanum]|nr:ATP-binding protein [Fibrisoma montanum]
MHRLLLIFLGLLSTSFVGAQSVDSAETIRVMQQLADNYWRFQAGDSLAWADPTYDDRAWELTSPAEPLIENKALWASGRGWFRLPVKVEKRLVGQDFQLVIEQYGSSEVYLDGRRLAVLQPPGTDSAGSQRIAQLIPFRLTDTSRHLLAVRYWFPRQPVYYANVDINPFKMQLEKRSEAGQNLILSHRWIAGLDYSLAGIFLLLGLLHSLFYRANAAQRINWWLGLMMLAFGAFFLLNGLSALSNTLQLYSLIVLVANLLGYAGLALLLTAVYHYLNRRRGKVYWLISCLLLVDVMYQIVIGPLPEPVAGVAIAASLIEYVRVSWLGKRRGDVDARLPWNSLRIIFFVVLVGFVILIVLAFLSVVLGDVDSLVLMSITTVTVLIALLAIPLGLSLSLVRDYARTYQSLRQKLREVEDLSARTIAQEQEKQHLLAVQNETLEQQVAERTAALQQSLADLRATQAQLIQREKLASLGELTAGIAHEIQNPLNFVNNFAEVSLELVQELDEEHEKEAERDHDLERDLLTDLQQNLAKIGEHGHRAANIVRGMLEHSRVGTGQKQPTDLNALVDEYLRLSYHGLRRAGDPATDKTVNYTLLTDLAGDLPSYSVVPQDIGRVLLNLFNNAFYAVGERQKQETAAYQPTVSVRTQRLGDRLSIQIRDNGSGIPAAVIGKIFQPFFTTKPTGQGTGLGLSISYDIITNGHGGTLTVQSEPGQFTEFTITLPIPA